MTCGKCAECKCGDPRPPLFSTDFNGENVERLQQILAGDAPKPDYVVPNHPSLTELIEHTKKRTLKSSTESMVQYGQVLLEHSGIDYRNEPENIHRELRGIDPLGEFLSERQKGLIVDECRENIAYFIYVLTKSMKAKEA